jgi:hypothetical protein
MTERPVTLKSLVAASNRLVQMSMAMTRLIRGSRAAARMTKPPPRENPIRVMPASLKYSRMAATGRCQSGVMGMPASSTVP